MRGKAETLAGRLPGSISADMAIGKRVQITFERLAADMALPGFSLLE
jgi:hypothetical protein